MNDNWNISGLILEGICGTGKSTIFRSIIQSRRFVQKSFLSSVILSEHQTQRVLERKEREYGLTQSDNISLLDQHVTYLELARDRLEQMPWCTNNRTNMRIPFILERFHFTHVYHYEHMSWQDVQEIDFRLAKLNCKLCLLTVDDSMLKHRIITSRDADWRDYLSRYGGKDDEIIEYYSIQQRMLLDLCGLSALETLVVDTTESTVEETLDQVLSFWGAI